MLERILENPKIPNFGVNLKVKNLCCDVCMVLFKDNLFRAK